LAFRPWEEVQAVFGLHEDEHGQFLLMQRQVPPDWYNLLRHPSREAQPDDWLGVFDSVDQEFPNVVFCASHEVQPPIVTAPIGLRLSPNYPCFLVGTSSRSLIPLPRHQADSRRLEGMVRRIRIIHIEKGDKESARTFSRYLGRLADLSFDPGQWMWRSGGLLHSYTAKKGRNLRKPRVTLARPIHLKWQGLLAADFVPDWRDVWHKDRPQKEAAFLWSIYHNAVAVNAWRHRIFPRTPEQCPCYTSDAPETRVHAFYDCPETRLIWNFAFSVIYRASPQPIQREPWPRLTWSQCLFNEPLPAPLTSVQDIWTLIRGAVLWILWLRRNAIVFRHERWNQAKLDQMAWEAILDFPRTSWYKLNYLRAATPLAYPYAHSRFQNTWV
jgi:hypothetical protein